MLHPSPNVIVFMRRRLLGFFPAVAPRSGGKMQPGETSRDMARVPLSRTAPGEQNASRLVPPPDTLIKAHKLVRLAGGWC